MRLQGVIFDLDGTLGDTLPICISAFQRALSRVLGKEFAAEDILSRFGPSEEGIILGMAPGHYDEVLSTYLSEYERAHGACADPFPGIRTTIELLTSRAIQLAVVTGKGPRSAVISMRFLGLDSTIPIIECGSPSGANKPEMIGRVLERWGFKPQCVAYVGDTPYDMVAAIEAGVVPLGAAWAETSTVNGTRPGRILATFNSVAEFNSWIEMELEFCTSDRHIVSTESRQ